jgi:hypothetical protein
VVSLTVKATTGTGNPHIQDWFIGSTNSAFFDAFGNFQLASGGGFSANNGYIAGGSFEFASHGGAIVDTQTAPTIAGSGCGGSAASILVNNGTAAFKIGVGSTPSSACTITMPAATTGWNCSATDITTDSTSVFLQKQTGAESTTSVTITNYNDTATATAFVASDVLKVICRAD